MDPGIAFDFSSFLQSKIPTLVICNDKEEAAYLLNDLEQFSSQDVVYLFPDSFRRPGQYEELDNFQVQQRVEAIYRFGKRKLELL